jgi:hypothetical protein
MFSKIVPAFTPDNVGALGQSESSSHPLLLIIFTPLRFILECITLTFVAGPLVLVAVLYELIGMVIALLVKQFFWVPHRFRYGIIVAGGWGNWGDIREHHSVSYRSPCEEGTER